MISPELKGIEVTVLVSDQPATEYRDEDAEKELTKEKFDPLGDKVHIIRYIEAKPGEPFAVRVVRTPEFVRKSHHIACAVQVDKKVCKTGQEVHFGKAPKDSWDKVYRDHHIRTSPTHRVKQTWHFAALELDADESQLLSAEEIKKHSEDVKCLASIKIRLYHMKETLEKKMEEFQPGVVREEYNNIPEKALKGKALGLTASYKNTTKEDLGPVPRAVLRYNDRYERPFAVFEFRYRTRENLYQEGILERPVENEDEKTIARGTKRELDNQDDLAERPKRAYKERRLRSGRFEVDLTLSDLD
ncbi:hypothetical protein MCOR25_005621 [Pyricularia grisea]|nr:hypothetical protein MCOR25_005621 [Pyricularia grisea]